MRVLSEEHTKIDIFTFILLSLATLLEFKRESDDSWMSQSFESDLFNESIGAVISSSSHWLNNQLF